MKTSLKAGFAQIFSCCSKNLGCRPPRPPPPLPPGPYAYARHLVQNKSLQMQSVTNFHFNKYNNTVITSSILFLIVLYFLLVSPIIVFFYFLFLFL